MSVLPLTLVISLLLTIFFLLLFWRDRSKRATFHSAEHEALLPLAEEQASHKWRSRDDEHENDHVHGSGVCGCSSGLRPPCKGCLKRTTVSH